MSFMKLYITDSQLGWEVETKNGTYYVPSDVLGVPEELTVDSTVPENLMEDTKFLLEMFIPTEWDHVVEITIVEGYFGRLSVPGYLDCTDWCFDQDAKDLATELIDTYGLNVGDNDDGREDSSTER